MLVYKDSVYIKSVWYAACEMHTLLAYYTSLKKKVFITHSCWKTVGFLSLFQATHSAKQKTVFAWKFEVKNIGGRTATII